MYANMQLFDWAVLTTLCWQQVLQSFTTHLYLQKKRSWRFIDKGIIMNGDERVERVRKAF